MTVTVHDDGGTSNGGADTTRRVLRDSTCGGERRAGRRSAGDVTSSEDSGAQTRQWAALAAGPTDESGQTLSVTTANDDPALFECSPP